jgi:hypothetical protein
MRLNQLDKTYSQLATIRPVMQSSPATDQSPSPSRPCRTALTAGIGHVARPHHVR